MGNHGSTVSDTSDMITQVTTSVSHMCGDENKELNSETDINVTLDGVHCSGTIDIGTQSENTNTACVNRQSSSQIAKELVRRSEKALDHSFMIANESFRSSTTDVTNKITVAINSQCDTKNKRENILKNATFTANNDFNCQNARIFNESLTVTSKCQIGVFQSIMSNTPALSAVAPVTTPSTVPHILEIAIPSALLMFAVVLLLYFSFHHHHVSPPPPAAAPLQTHGLHKP